MGRSASRHIDRYAAESLAGVRQEIAMRAGRLVAEEGLDYANAKRKAARDILGQNRGVGNWLPDNAEIEEEVRAYQALFQADTQPQRLFELRSCALALMRKLAQFRPHLCGAVLNGTAGDHSDIRLQLFCDSAKDVQIFLLNEGIEFEAGEAPASLPLGRGRYIETAWFLWRPDGDRPAEGVHLDLYGTDDLRGALCGERRSERADLGAVEALFEGVWRNA